MRTIIVTGGSGFIGSNFLQRFVLRQADVHFINVDKLPYAGNPMSLSAIENSENYSFEQVDICDSEAVTAVFQRYDPDCILHFAAESHVDRSIHAPRDFFTTNVGGTLNLLECCRAHWQGDSENFFHHVSTDEVYGSLPEDGYFTEATPYDPSSPYSASKASSDHLVRAYHRTYGLAIKLTNCSNNYGPYQFPEKLIPLMILNAGEGLPLPVYGNGKNVRDWLYVTDHCDAIWRIIQQGRVGETYNVGGDCEKTNIDVVRAICDGVATATDQEPSSLRDLIRFVPDRPGHDFRYAIDASKVQKELGWKPTESFESGLKKTVQWYLSNVDWIAKVRSGEYREWLKSNYEERNEG